MFSVVSRRYGGVCRLYHHRVAPKKYIRPQKIPTKKERRQQQIDLAVFNDDHPLINRTYPRNPDYYFEFEKQETQSTLRTANKITRSAYK